MYTIIVSANNDNFTSSFPILLPLFWMIVLARTSNIVLSKRTGTQLFIVDTILAVGVSYFYLFYYIKIYSLHDQFVEGFYNERHTLSNALFCIYWDDHMSFIFHSINVIYHIYWFAYGEPSLHLRGKSHFIFVYDTFNVLLNSVC